MKVFVIVGYNAGFENTSARAAFSKKEDAQAWTEDATRCWFDDRTEIVELELDGETDGTH